MAANALGLKEGTYLFGERNELAGILLFRFGIDTQHEIAANSRHGGQCNKQNCHAARSHVTLDLIGEKS